MDAIENFIDPNPKFRWYEMLPDLAIGKVKEPNKCGLLSIKMTVHDRTANGPFVMSSSPAWKKGPPKRPLNKLVRAFVY